MKANNKTERMFVKFVNSNSAKVKALSELMLMSDAEKIALINQFKKAAK